MLNFSTRNEVHLIDILHMLYSVIILNLFPTLFENVMNNMNYFPQEKANTYISSEFMSQTSWNGAPGAPVSHQVESSGVSPRRVGSVLSAAPAAFHSVKRGPVRLTALEVQLISKQHYGKISSTSFVPTQESMRMKFCGEEKPYAALGVRSPDGFLKLHLLFMWYF